MRKSFLIVSASISILLLTSLYVMGAPRWSEASTFSILVLVAVAVAFQLFSRDGGFNLFRHFPLALLSILVVHIQYHIDFIVGNVDKSAQFWVAESVVMEALLLSSVGILAFLLFYTIGRTKFEINSVRAQYIDARPLLVSSICLLMAFYGTVNPAYLAGYYGFEGMGTEAAYFIQLFRASFFALVIIKTRNLKLLGKTDLSMFGFLRELGIGVLGMMVLYLGTIVFIGDRGPLITYTLCIVGNYLFLTKRFPSIKVSILAVAIGAIAISALGDIRRFDREIGVIDRLMMNLEEESRFTERSFSPATQNLANSIRTLHTVVDYVPREHDHTLGMFQLKQILSIIPFSGALHEVIFSDTSYKYRSTSTFTTWIVQGDNPFSGEGTTVIADLYIDFGILGVLLGMGVYGLIIAKSERVITSNNMPSVFLHALSITYLANAVYIARATLLGDMKFVVWTFVFIILNTWISKTYSRK